MFALPASGSLVEAADGSLYGVTYHGPYDDSPFSPAHNLVSDPFTARDDSRLCGQCHQVDNPDEHLYDAAGNDTGRVFPLDTTYSEWLHSAYSTGAGAKTCQGCHMVREAQDLPVAKDGPVRPTPSRHAFVGGNVWGLDAVRAAAAPGELDGLEAAFAANRAAALQNLSAAADVQVLLPDGPLPVDTDVQVKVRVFNRTGHKLPTGYADGRRVFLELRVNDQVVSGAYDGDAGALVPDPQLAVFEAVHGRSDGGLDHLALHDTILKDTRIEPLGFVPDVDTAPVGISFLRDADGGSLGAVEWTYHVRFPGPAVAGGTGTVEARLFHQATTRDYVEALAAANLPVGRRPAPLHLEAISRAGPDDQRERLGPFHAGIRVTGLARPRRRPCRPRRWCAPPGTSASAATSGRPLDVVPAGSREAAAWWLQAVSRTRSGRLLSASASSSGGVAIDGLSVRRV
jgi:hypothetical protein